jgi:hypothetical protein
VWELLVEAVQIVRFRSATLANGATKAPASASFGSVHGAPDLGYCRLQLDLHIDLRTCSDSSLCAEHVHNATTGKTGQPDAPPAPGCRACPRLGYMKMTSGHDSIPCDVVPCAVQLSDVSPCNARAICSCLLRPPCWAAASQPFNDIEAHCRHNVTCLLKAPTRRLDYARLLLMQRNTTEQIRDGNEQAAGCFVAVVRCAVLPASGDVASKREKSKGCGSVESDLLHAERGAINRYGIASSLRRRTWPVRQLANQSAPFAQSASPAGVLCLAIVICRSTWRQEHCEEGGRG